MQPKKNYDSINNKSLYDAECGNKISVINENIILIVKAFFYYCT